MNAVVLIPVFVLVSSPGQCMLQFLHVVMDYFGRFLAKPHSLNHSLPAYALLGLPKYPT